MKRTLTLFLFFTLCLSTALAAEWPEGLGPGKPYSAVKEVNPEEELGYMMFYPSQDDPAAKLCRTLFIYLPREDVAPGDGTLQLCTRKDGAVLSIPMRDEALVLKRPLTETELTALRWGGGTCFEIQLPTSLQFGKDYYVKLAEGCIVTQGGLQSPAISKKNAWSFMLSGDYGIGGLAYRRPQVSEPVVTPQAGDEISFELLLGGNAASAALYSRDASVDFPVTSYQASGHVTGTVIGDSPTWGVLFFDEAGNPLDQLEF